MVGAVSMAAAMPPVVKERLQRPRSVFAPGSRIRMNVVPMILNLFFPWAVFVVCCGLTSFSTMYDRPSFVSGIIAGIFTLWLGSVVVAFWARRGTPEPTWFAYASLMVGFATIMGTWCGLSNYQQLARRFYQIRDLKVIHQLDVGKQLGQNIMDAGVVQFTEGSRLDLMRSWHFKHRSVYCVVPIVGNSSQPETRTYDFWAVGTDCCSTTSSDFRCGAWRLTQARGAIRVLDDEALPFYRLAVQQAETLYGVVAAHPVFFTWSPDPLAEVRSWDTRSHKNFLLIIASAFLVSLICLTLATWKFAWLGRTESVYGMEFYNDPDWTAGEGYRTAGFPEPRGYSA